MPDRTTGPEPGFLLAGPGCEPRVLLLAGGLTRSSSLFFPSPSRGQRGRELLFLTGTVDEEDEAVVGLLRSPQSFFAPEPAPSRGLNLFWSNCTPRSSAVLVARSRCLFSDSATRYQW